MLRSADGGQIVEHSGSTNEQQTTLKLVPERNFALIILTNASRGVELHGELASWILAEHLGYVDRPPEIVSVAPGRLDEYVGRYEQALSSVDVRAEGGTLVLQVKPRGGFPVKDSPPGPTPPPVRFAFWSEDRIIGLELPLKGARAEFIRGSDGQIAFLRSGGRLGVRQP